ncbi:ABC transporter permease [Luteimicrobium subarcticum]|uniref:NitT/TauT family transport system permease protein n=1 Tax=Luteimicrobium subarcticum TaxID=620910 RepID=A0A2M8WVA8_9MICO|nr:ABC transporter permease [Luteimicrobium subarcticum]PJI94826.1 NitT/TauT family transport system permease protein [Luteimicrobium subarcticum]
MPTDLSAETSRDTPRDTLGALEAGLDALQTDARDRDPWPRRLGRSVLPPVLAVVILLAIWQVVYALHIKPDYVIPGPAQAWDTASRLWDDGSLQRAVWTSLSRGVIGFVASVIIGTPLGIVVARVRWVRVAFGPIISGLQVLPSVAWVPAAIIWFGLSDATVYFVVLMGATPSIINGIVGGVDQVPPLLRRAGLVLGAGPVQLVRHVILPAALPGYVAGLKQGWAFSWRSLMAAEIIAVGGSLGFGLGSLLSQGRDLADMTVVFVAIVAILLVGILIEMAFFAPVEKRLLRRRGLLQS